MRSTKTLFALVLPVTGCLCADDPGNLVPETVVEDPTLPGLDLNGTRFHTEAYGDPAKPVIMVMHGGPGGDYRCLLGLKALADDGFRVVFWDQRSTGLSARVDPDSVDLDVYLEDLRQMIDHHAPSQPVVFIAQSWGAMYATAFINQYGDYGGRIKGAIYTEPGAFTRAQLDGFIDRLQKSMSLVGEQLNDALWMDQFVSATDHERADYKHSLFEMRGAPSEHRDPNNLPPFWRAGALVNQRMLTLARSDQFDWTTNLGTFTRKVLFLRGDLNTAATLEHQQELAAEYPNAEIATISGVGHEVIWERTDDYLIHARAYLREIGATQW